MSKLVSIILFSIVFGVMLGCSAKDDYFSDDENKILASKKIVTTGETVKFSLLNDDDDFIWCVNGVPGGNSEVGTIDQNGFFQAPWILKKDKEKITISAYSYKKPNIRYQTVLECQATLNDNRK